MDEQQARQLLGVDTGPVSPWDLREARNNALKAHHPDKVGSDPAAVKRSTYWTAQINAAYQLLESLAAGAKPLDQSSAQRNGAKRQSFTALARRAHERAAAQATHERAAAQERVDAMAGRRSSAQSNGRPLYRGDDADDYALTAEQAHEDVPAAFQAFTKVVLQGADVGSPLPGRRLANVLFNAAGHGRWDIHGRALAMLCGSRNAGRWQAAAQERPEQFITGATTYMKAFCAEFRRVDTALRKGGRSNDSMTKHVWDPSVDDSATREWVDAFAIFEHSDFESELGIKPARR